MKTINTALTSLLILLLVGINVEPSLAHHSFAAEFDASTTGELTGVITQVRYSNPHVRYRIDVTTQSGDVESWELQVGSVTSIRSQGWLADSIQIGDTVKVRGQLGRNNSRKLFIRGVETADGRQFGSTNNNQRNNDRNEVNASAEVNYARGQVNPAHPFDISGPWRNTYKFRPTVDDLEPKPTPYTAEGQRIRDNTQRYDDPALRCISLGLPRIFGNPYNMDIYDAGDHYLFLYVEHNSPRRIWMDGRTASQNTVPTANGYSVGHWEGDELVIETTYLLSGWLDGSGLPMSGEGTRTVERYVYQDDRLSVDRTMTIYDPYYTEPLIRVRGSARQADLDVFEQDSCDPASYYVDLLEADLLEEYLQP